MSSRSVPAFQPLTSIYEPSAIQQLADGRFLVIEDEKSDPFTLVTLGADGVVDTQPMKAGLLQLLSSFWSLDDLEGLALDASGFIYAITWHSRDDAGDETKSREKLVRFRIEGHRVVGPKVIGDLKHALTDQHPVLATAARLRKVKAAGGLNIEALEVSPEQQRLLIGFRSPLHEGRALIASVENLTAMFEADEAPRVAAMLDRLDLGGQGIRALSYLPSLGSYLVVGGPASAVAVRFDLWLWSGRPGAPARRVTVPGLRSVERAEGVCPAVIGGQECIVVVSDDGSRKDGRFARYLVLDPTQLQTAA